MRRVLLTLAIVGLIATALLVAALISLSRIVVADRDRIVRRVQAAIGRPVEVDAITVGVWGGLGVQLLGVRIAEDPRFGSGDFLRAVSITGRADLLSLLGGTLHVSRIDLTGPVLHIVRNEAGAWNFASLHKAAVAEGPPDARKNPGAGPEALAALIARADIANGTVEFTDTGIGRPQTARATHVDLTLADVSETTPVRFSLDAALNGDTRNVQLTGSVGPVNDLTAIPITIAGALGPVGRQRLRVDGLQVAGVVTPDAFRATTLTGRAFGGQFGFKSEFPREASGTAWLTGNVSGADVADIMRLVMPNAGLRITGTAQLTADLRSAGTSPEVLERNLRGTVEVTVRNGVIQDFNIVKEVLGKVAGLPGISSLISATVKPKYGRLFAEPETRLETLHGTFRVADQRVQTDDLSLVAADFGVRAAGSVGFDRQVDMVGTLMMSERFSRDVATDVKAVRRILDENGQLVIPFRLRGRLGVATPTPELGGLIRAMTVGAADDLVGKLLGEGGQKGARGNVIEKGLRELFGQ